MAESPEERASRADMETVRPEFRPQSPRARRRRRGARSGDLFFLLVVFVIVVLLLAYDFDRIAAFFTNPTAGIVLIVMVVEYLVLKSMDRTRAYETENIRLRERLRTERELMAKARALLEEKIAHDKSSATDEELAQWRARANDLAADLPTRRTAPAPRDS